MESTSIEARVAALEEEVRRLRTLVEEKAGWRGLVGVFRDDPLFEEAMKYGRQYREAQRPKKPRKKKK